MSNPPNASESTETPTVPDATSERRSKDGEGSTSAGSGRNGDKRKYSDAYTDATADVELVSSDGVVLKVHSYHLMTASVVFRDMFGGKAAKHDGSRVIELTDETIEKSSTVRDFLDCVHGKELFDTIKSDDRAKRLIAILQKYDCPTWLTILRHTTGLASARMTDTLNPYVLFKISAALDDPLGCREVLPAAGRQVWIDECDDTRSEDQADMRKCVAGKSALDIASMNEEALEAIPLKYLGALARGFSKRGDTKGSATGGNWQAVADEFYRALTYEAKKAEA